MYRFSNKMRTGVDKQLRIFVWFALFITATCTNLAPEVFADNPPFGAPIVVDDDRYYAEGTLFEERFIALKAFPRVAIWQAKTKGLPVPSIETGWMIDQFKNDQELKMALVGLEIDPDTAKLEEIGKAAALADKNYYKNRLGSKDPSIILPANAGRPALYNSYFVMSLIDTELIKGQVENKKFAEVLDAGFVEINQEVWGQVAPNYFYVQNLDAMPPNLAAREFYNAMKALEKFPELLDRSKIILNPVQVSPVSIVRPEELDIRVPMSISELHDIYVLFFAINIWDEVDTMEKIGFLVEFPEGFIAHDLIPLKFGKEVEVASGAGIEGKAEVSLGPITVSFNPMFRKSFAYKELRPSIVAKGLQANYFSWEIEGQALEGGALRFACILGVPSGLESSSVKYSFYGKTHASIFAEGDFAATPPFKDVIKYPLGSSN